MNNSPLYKHESLWAACLPALALCASALLCSCDRAAAADTPAPAKNDAATPVAEKKSAPKGEWVAVRKGPLREFAQASGTLYAPQVTTIGTLVPGRVKEVKVDIDSRIKKGDPLVVIDDSLFAIERDMRQADLDVLNVEVSAAEVDLTRMKNLWEKPKGEEPSIPKKRYDDAVVRLSLAQAKSKQAVQALKYAQRRLDETVVTAPYDGVVSARFVHPGDPVRETPVTDLLEIQRNDVLNLEFTLPQRFVAGVSSQTRLDYAVDGVPGLNGETKVAVIFPYVDRETRAIRCRATLDNVRGQFKAGMLVRVTARVTDVDNALVLPAQALRKDTDGWHVLARGAKGDEQDRKVSAGEWTENEVRVIEGVAEGESVLVPEDGGK